MWNGAVISLVVLTFMLGMCEFIIIGIISEIGQSFDVSLTQAGMLISYFAIAYAVGTPLISIWASRFSRYRFTILLTALFVVANCLVFFVHDYTFMLVDRIFLAVLSGTLYSVSTTFAPDVVERRYMGDVIAWLNGGFAIAAVFGLPLGVLTAKYVDWPVLFVGLGILTAIDLLVMVSVLPKQQNKVKRSSFFKELSLLKDHRVIIAWGIVICNAGASYCWYSYITPFLQDIVGVSFAWVSPILLLIGACTIASNFIGGRIASQGGFYILWMVVAVHAVLTYSLSLVAPYTIVGTMGVLFFLGMLFYVQSASAQVYFFHISLTFHPGTTFMAGACSPTAFNVGVALGTAVGSLTLDMAGLHWISIPGGIFMMTSAFLMWYIMNPERKRLRRFHHSS